ncbi:MAG: NUDIX domain-containing protein, partial [Myxococcota bacterium]
PVPAVSVVVVRNAPFRVLMVQRARRSRSWAGLWVFPGGRIEPEESQTLAASRELFEETGLLLRAGAIEPGEALGASDRVAGAMTGASEPDTLRELRRQVHDGELDFTEVLSGLDERSNSAPFVSLARWITPSLEPRRFDASFFLIDASHVAAARLDAADPDGKETIRARWWVPASAVSDYRSGNIELAPPTLRILEDLAAWGGCGASVRAAQERPIAPIVPRIVPGTEPATILMPYDAAYGSTPGDGVRWHAELGAELYGPSRFVRRDGQWHSESGDD